MTHDDRILVLRTVAANPMISHNVFMAVSDLLFGKPDARRSTAQRAVDQGESKLRAIMLFRQWTGADLKTAKEAIEYAMEFPDNSRFG
jgi:ribosomal protein L7/L12